MQRVAAIGLDSAEITLIDDLVRRGRMPVLERFRDSSRRHRLTSTVEYRTGHVWPRFLTGRGGDATRIAGFDPATYTSFKCGARSATRFFDGDPVAPAVLFDVPYTNLSVGDDPAVVTAWGGHDPAYPRASRPRGLLREIDRRFGPHPAAENDYTAWWFQPSAVAWHRRALVEGARRRGAIVPWLLETFPDHRFFATVMSEPHSAGEFFWHGVDDDHLLSGSPTAAAAEQALTEVYEAVDAALGQMLAALDPDCAVMIFSPYGMRGNEGDVPSMVLLPELLFREYAGRPGLRELDTDSWRAAGCQPIEPDPRWGWDRHVQTDSLLGSRGWSKRLPSLSTNPLMSAALATRSRLMANQRFFRLVGRRPIADETDRTPEQIGEPRFSQSWQVPSSYRAWWPRMRAFALPTFYDGRVRINLAGRERDGIVAPADYSGACDEVEELVAACRDLRTGESLVTSVVRPRADDPLAADGPDADLVFTWRPQVDAISHPSLGTIGPFPMRRTGSHSPDGFAYIRAPSVGAGDAGCRSADDISATLADLLGTRPSSTIEGRSLLHA